MLLQSAFAPESNKITIFPSIRVGKIGLVAGLFTPFILPSLSVAPTKTAPVEPADTNAPAFGFSFNSLNATQIELFGFSPSIFRYNYWKGLYRDNLNRYLYVNVGAGTVAMPMRIGATPEITVLTLNNAK